MPFLFFFLSWKPGFEPESFGPTILGPEQIGSWVAVVGTNVSLPAPPAKEVNWRVRFCSGCYEQLRKVELSLGDAERPLWIPRPLSGDPYTLSATLRMPAAFPKKGVYLWLTVEDSDGRHYAVSWLVSAR